MEGALLVSVTRRTTETGDTGLMPEECRIAVVDDDENLTTMLGEFLANRGLTMVPFNSAEAMLATDTANYHAIVLDIHLPGMWGSECVYKLRNSGYKGPVIAMTGYLGEWDEEDLSDLGFSHVFEKPFEPDTIAGVIRQCLDASPSSA